MKDYTAGAQKALDAFRSVKGTPAEDLLLGILVRRSLAESCLSANEWGQYRLLIYSGIARQVFTEEEFT